MSTLGQLYALLGQNPVQPYAEGLKTVLGNERQETSNQTDLIRLAELQRAQETAERERQYYRAHPEAALVGGMQSTLGGGMPPGPPGGGPMMQQTVMPGSPPGAPQVVPGGQDLSRYAQVSPQGGGPIPPNVMSSVMPTSTPPTSTIGQPGPQPQRPDPMVALMRTDPDAAFAVQQRIQKIQDARLNKTLGEASYAARFLQGVTDQESYDVARRDLAREMPQYVAQLPPVYSKEALEPFIARATDVSQRAKMQVDDLQAQAALLRARKEGRATDVDNQLIGMGVRPGQETPEQMREALRLVQEGKKDISASHGTGQIVMTPAGAIRVGKDNQVEVIKGPDGQPIYDKPTAAAEAAASYGDRAKRAHDNAVALEKKGITPSLWAKVGNALPLGLGDYLVGEDQRDYQRAVNQFGGALLRKESGAVISATEYNMIDRTFFPQPNDSKKQIEDKRLEREAIIKSLQEEGKGTGRPPTQAKPTNQAQPTSQAPAAAGEKPASQGSARPVGQMSPEEIAAEIAAIKARGGK